MSTVNELVSNLKNRLRDQQADTYILQAINWCRRDIVTRRNWAWAQTLVGGLRTLGPATITDDVTVTLEGTSVTVATADDSMDQLVTDVAAGIEPHVTFTLGGDRFYRVTAATGSGPYTLSITPGYFGASSAAEDMVIYFREYALTSGTRKIANVVGEDGHTLGLRTLSEIAYANGEPTESTGQPRFYAVRGGMTPTLILDPIPDDNYSIAFDRIGALTDVSVNGTEASVVVPAEWHFVIEEGALYFLRRDVKDDDRWADTRDMYLEYLGRMERADLTGGFASSGGVIHATRSRHGMAQQRRASRS